MELRAAILVNIALATLSAALPVDMVGQHVFYQKLDHFNPYNQEYFKQRYFKFDYYFRDGAPIFLEIGGENPQNGYIPGFIAETARKNNGIVFALEHRYYGMSVPESYIYGRPTYLTSEQALADIANFIQVQKEQYPNSPWIVSGCSYAGNLATWVRQKYPHLVQGAIAGSAPVLAKADFYEFYEVIGEILKKKAPLCYQKLVEANEEFTTLTKTYDGRRKLGRMLGSSSYDPMSGALLHTQLALTVSHPNGIAVQNLQYYQPYTSELCNSIVRNSHGKSALEILINELRSRLRTETLESIITRDFDTRFLNQSPQDKKMWIYQTCNEFGYFQTTSSSKKHPFGAGFNFSLTVELQCAQWNIDLEMVEDNVRKTNLRYGGKTPNVTNVVFLHGSNDPWHPLGVLRDLSSSARAFVFEGLFHCEFYNGRRHFQQQDDRIPQWEQMLDEIDSIVRSWL